MSSPRLGIAGRKSLLFAADVSILLYHFPKLKNKQDKVKNIIKIDELKWAKMG